MSLLVQDAMEEAGEAVGLCPDNPASSDKLLRLVNRIERRLINESGARARASICLPISGGCATLPDYVAQIRRAEVDHSPAHYRQARERHWIGETRPFHDGRQTLITDLGGKFATYRDWPGSRAFYAVSDTDDEVELTLVGVDAANRRIAETLIVTKADPDVRPQLTRQTFANRFLAIRKGTSNGYVHLFAYDPGTVGNLWVSTLAPNEVNPELRRISVPDYLGDGSLFAEVELRHVPHCSPLEVYLINSREAIYHAAQALDAEDDDPAVFERSNNRAVSQMRKEARRERGAMPRPRVKLWRHMFRNPFGRTD